jgi:hypothetical protein
MEGFLQLKRKILTNIGLIKLKGFINLPKKRRSQINIHGSGKKGYPDIEDSLFRL